MSQQQTSVTPEIPPEIQNRRPVALTHAAAEDGSAQPRDGLTDAGKSGRINPGLARYMEQKKAGKKGQTARQKADALFASEPLRGMPAAAIEEVRGRTYDGAPEMDGNLGDRTPAFVNWLFKHHPKDAAIRYAYRSIWPTE
jgi:hypothetical protein